jgi:hypothetical protein
LASASLLEGSRTGEPAKRRVLIASSDLRRRSKPSMPDRGSG